MTMLELRHSPSIADGKVCSICLEEFVTNSIIIGHGLHFYDPECLGRALAIKNECPYCKVHFDYSNQEVLNAIPARLRDAVSHVLPHAPMPDPIPPPAPAHPPIEVPRPSIDVVRVFGTANAFELHDHHIFQLHRHPVEPVHAAAEPVHMPINYYGW